MKEKIIFEGKSKAKEITYDKDSNLFYFYFEEIRLIPTEFWRFFKNNKVELVSKDHNLKYSFQEPKMDLISFLNNELKNEYLLKIEITNNNDLILYFSSTKKIEVYITSMAFENWQITIENKQYICLQGGYDIAIFK